MTTRWVSLLCTAVAVMLVVGAAVAADANAPAAGGPPIKIGAIFAVTGPASFLGMPESRTAEMLVEKINKSGGVSGRPIQLLIKDSGGKPENAVSMAKQLIDEEKVLAIIGPSTSGETMAIKNLCQEGKTILISCAAAENIVDPLASYVFKVPQRDSDAVRLIYKTMKERGVSRIGIISSNDGYGVAGKGQLEKLAGEFGITVVISEAYDKAETDLTGVLTKLKGQKVEAVVNWSIVPAQSLVAKNMKQIGLEVPLYQSMGFGNIKYVQAAGDSANGTLFPCGRLLVAEALPASHPQKAVLMAYKTEYEGRFKEDVSTFGGHPYDALLILTEAIKKAGSTDAAKVRDAMETIKGLPGTAGIFNLSAKDHCGLTIDAFEMLTVKDGKFAIAQPAANKATMPATAPAASAPAATAPVAAAPMARGTVKVGAIFSVTGPAANLGAPEQKTAEMLVEKINAAGGINGAKIQLLVKDSGGKPENAVSLAKQFIDEDKVLAIIGPSTSGETMAIKGICQENKTLLISCAAAETIVNPVASYVFKTPQKDSDAARAIYGVMKAKGIKKIGVIVSNDGFGQAGKAQLDKLAGEYGVAIAISESYDKNDTDLTGVLTKVKGQDVQAVVNWSIVPAQALVAKNMKQIGLIVPLFQSHGFGNIRYVQAGGEAANGTIFPAGRLLVAEVLPDSHPQKALLVQYKKDYESRYKEDVSTFGGHAYDAVLVLTEAMKQAGSNDREKVRSALENLKGTVGTAGIFNMSATDHNGLTMDAFEILTVKDGKFAVYQK